MASGVYIVHIHSKVHHAGHYTGHADDLDVRLQQHRETDWIPLPEPVMREDGKIVRGRKVGEGTNLLAYCNHFGIPWELARFFEGADHAFEHKLKKTHQVARYCPFCNPNARDYQPKGINS